MFACTAQLFLRFLSIGFRDLAPYPGLEKSSFLLKRSQKTSFSSCAASTQPKTKPEDSCFLPGGEPDPTAFPEKWTTIFRRSKRPAFRRVPPQGLIPGSDASQACRSLPPMLFTTASREPYRFAHRLICSVTHAPAAPIAARMLSVCAVLQTMNNLKGLDACRCILSRTLKEPPFF